MFPRRSAKKRQRNYSNIYHRRFPGGSIDLNSVIQYKKQMEGQVYGGII